MLLHVTNAEYLGSYRLSLRFNNGFQGIVDLESELYGEIFEPLRNKKMFQQFILTSRTVEWPNGADFAPEFLFEAALKTVKPGEQDKLLYPLPMEAIDRKQSTAVLHEPTHLSQYSAIESEES
jgi:hypothetical protein